jgi:hypothetical protein
MHDASSVLTDVYVIKATKSLGTLNDHSQVACILTKRTRRIGNLISKPKARERIYLMHWTGLD